MRIYIPTRGRANKQTTLENLPLTLRNRAILVVDEMEKQEHWDLFGREKVLITPIGINSIGKVRQFILNSHNEKKYGPKLIMLDDDLGFNMRRIDIRSKFLPATDNSVIQGFNLVEDLLEFHAHGGVRARQMSQDAPDIEYNCRTLRALAYRTDIFHKQEISFERLIVMEDFDVTLQLLSKGFSNFNISTIIQGQSTSNAPGGCSIYRDAIRQAEGANGLANFHPEFVRVKTKKTNWTGWGSDERVDVNVSWKKAYKKGVQLHGKREI